MADVGTKERFQLGAVRVYACVEAPGVGRIVGLAAEIEIAREEVADVARLFDATRGVVINYRRSPRRPLRGGLFAFRHQLVLAHAIGPFASAVFSEQLRQLITIEI